MLAPPQLHAVAMAQRVATGSVTQMWQAALGEAQSRAHVRLPESQESYLVFTLVRHSRDAVLAGRTLALEFLDGLGGERALREDRLRDVGDRCLLIAGLFPGLGQRRCVGPDYYRNLGSAAYRELGAQPGRMMATLYAELALAFQALVRVLERVRVGPDGPPGAPTPVAVPAVATAQRPGSIVPGRPLH
jgi:hypothetical protein